MTLNANGTFTYTPKAGFSGTDTFVYTAKDSNGTSIANTTATITVPAPGAPVANNDTGMTAANTQLNGSTVLSNDSGTAPLTVDEEDFTQPTKGGKVTRQPRRHLRLHPGDQLLRPRLLHLHRHRRGEPDLGPGHGEHHRHPRRRT